MPLYIVNATMEVSAWATVEADSPDEAMEAAMDIDPSDFDYDIGTARVFFNVSPEVEPA